MWWGEKMVLASVSGKKTPKGSCSSSGKNRWEPGESLVLISSQQMKLIKLVSFLLLVQPFWGLGLRRTHPSASHWFPKDSSSIVFPLWPQTKTKSNSSTKTKAPEGLLSQSPRPGKGKKNFFPKLTKAKLAKQTKRAQSAQHDRHLRSEALEKPTEELQGSCLPRTHLKAIVTISGHRVDDQRIENHPKTSSKAICIISIAATSWY